MHLSTGRPVSLLVAATLLAALLHVLAPPLNAASDEFDLLLARGIEKLNHGEIEAAAALIDEALELHPSDPEALYYGGMAHSRMGNYDRAEKLLTGTSAGKEPVPEVLFELGRLYYLRSQCEKAKDLFSRYASVVEDNASKEYALQLADKCGKETEDRARWFNLSLGYQYDSNVILEPENPPIQDLQSNDHRAVFYAAAGADLLKTPSYRLGIDYRFYQSLHADLHDFNVNYNKLLLELETKIGARVKPVIGTAGEYTFFGGDSYSRNYKLFGKLMVEEGKGFSIDFAGEYSDDRYWDTDLYRANSLRTGHRTSLGARQNYRREKLDMGVFLFREDGTAEADFWDFEGYRTGLEALYRISNPLFLRVAGEYTKRDYQAASPGFGDPRTDHLKYLEVSLTWFPIRRWSISLTESWMTNDSNFEEFDYTRNIVGAFISFNFY